MAFAVELHVSPTMRPITRVAAYLSAGVATTVAVTWTLALRGNLWAPCDGFSVVRDPRDWIGLVPTHWPSTAEATDTYLGYGVAEFHQAAMTGTTVMELWAVIAGWPFHALQAEVTSEQHYNKTAPGFAFHRPSSRWREGISNRLAGGTDTVAGRTLPLVPLWPGFLADLSIYTLALAVLCEASLRFRHLSRQRGGRCVHCGQRRLASSLVCSECGAAHNAG